MLKTLLSKEYAAARRREIDPNRAAQSYKPLDVQPGAGAGRNDIPEARGDTIYMTVADRDGNVVSLIQSIFETFGAGIVAGDTGIALHNRGSLFTLDAGHPNVLAPGRRPLHTLIPAMVLRDGRPWVSYGVMGGDMQPQGHVQVLINLIDFGMNIQEAGEAARFRHSPAGLALESAIRRGRARGPRIARPQGHHEPRRLRGVSGDPDRSEDRRADGRIRSEKGRPRDRLRYGC